MTSSSTWINQISELKNNSKIKSRTCKTYVKHPEKEICQCGRLKPSHSYTTLHHLDLNERTDINVKWNEGRDSSSVPINVYGIRPSNGPKFIRCDNRTKPLSLYNLILNDCKKQEPTLLISAYGGAKYFTLSERLEKDFVTGIIDLATRA
ncbi:unnamed protein product, partial [Adineta steineri]